jgi:uncharacterized protein (DUF924 family)
MAVVRNLRKFNCLNRSCSPSNVSRWLSCKGARSDASTRFGAKRSWICVRFDGWDKTAERNVVVCLMDDRFPTFFRRSTFPDYRSDADTSIRRTRSVTCNQIAI